MVCCPDEIPTDCEESSWEFTPESSYYGCCSQDLSVAVGCWEGYYADDCDVEDCAFIDNYGGYVYCGGWK